MIAIYWIIMNLWLCNMNIWLPSSQIIMNFGLPSRIIMSFWLTFREIIILLHMAWWCWFRPHSGYKVRPCGIWHNNMTVWSCLFRLNKPQLWLVSRAFCCISRYKMHYWWHAWANSPDIELCDCRVCQVWSIHLSMTIIHHH